MSVELRAKLNQKMDDVGVYCVTQKSNDMKIVCACTGIFACLGVLSLVSSGIAWLVCEKSAFTCPPDHHTQFLQEPYSCLSQQCSNDPQSGIVTCISLPDTCYNNYCVEPLNHSDRIAPLRVSLPCSEGAQQATIISAIAIAAILACSLCYSIGKLLVVCCRTGKGQVQANSQA